MADGILWQLAANAGSNWGQQFDAGLQKGEQRALKNNRRSILQSLAMGPDGNLDVKSGVTQLIQAGDPEGALQVAQMHKAFAPETTDEIKEYNLYRSQGGADNFNDWKIKLKQAGATRINNSIQTGDNQYQKTIGESDAKGFIELNQAGSNAANRLNTLSVMENLMKNPNFYSGFGAESALRLNQALSAFGINNANVSAPNEAFRAMTNQLTLDATGGKLGAGISNSDVSFLQTINPNLATTPEGNRQIIGIQRKLAQRQQQVSALARQYAARNKGRFDQAGFNEFINQWAEQNPLFANEQRTTTASPQVSPLEAEMRRRGLLK